MPCARAMRINQRPGAYQLLFACHYSYAELVVVAVDEAVASCASCVSTGASGSARGMTDEVDAAATSADEDDEVDEAAEGEADENEVGTAGGVLVEVVGLPTSDEGGRDTLGFMLWWPDSSWAASGAPIEFDEVDNGNETAMASALAAVAAVATATLAP